MMFSHQSLVAVGLCLAVCIVARADEETWTVKGRVVDQQGNPVTDYQAAHYWSSNGVQWDERGNYAPPKGKQELPSFWANEGRMLPFPQLSAKVLDDGRFECSFPAQRPRASIFATDRERTFGGYVSVERKGKIEKVEIAFRPLVHVHGLVRCPAIGGPPGFTMAVVHPPGDKQNYLHFTHCGSLKGVLSFRLPPGKYDLQVYGQNPECRMSRPYERPDYWTSRAATALGSAMSKLFGEKAQHADDISHMPLYLSGVQIEVPGNTSEVDLGTLYVQLTRKGRLQAKKRWGDYRDHYGSAPPAITFTDARGVESDFQLANLQGKWVLLDFWHLACGVCITKSMPELMDFYAENHQLRGRFEIVSVCTDVDGSLKTVADWDSKTTEIVDRHWGGRRPDFPVLIDRYEGSWARYGVPGAPTLLLVNPDGRLVDEGDQSVLDYLKKQITKEQSGQAGDGGESGDVR